MKDLTQYYYLLTEDVERNKLAAQMFADVTGLHLWKFYPDTEWPYLRVSSRKDCVSNFFTVRDKNGITWEELCALHEEWEKNKSDKEIIELVFSEDPLKQALDCLEEAKLQIEYLHGKFRETGSGNSVLSRMDTILKKHGR